MGYLKFDDFKNFIDKYDIEKVELSNKGEIFLNPELSEIIKYAHKKDIAYSAADGVNGNYLTDDMAELLVKTQCRELTFSIDGATNDVYKIYRVGGNLDKVLENLKKVLFYKNKYSSQYPFVSYKFIVFGHNEHEIIPAKEKAKEDMQKMLDYVDKLDELDTSSVEPMSHIFQDENVFREDVVTNGDNSQAMLANAPKAKDGQYQVPKTIG